MDSFTNAPSISTQDDGSTATQADGAIATTTTTATQEVATATQVEATDGELPQFHLAK